MVDEQEEWRAVVGFEGLYEVSNLGRVRGVERAVPRGGHVMSRKGRIMGQFENRHPKRPDHVRCIHVNLSKANRVHARQVHRLVLEAFVGPAPAGTEGCHQDGVVHNNRLDNLRWDTHRENMADIFRHGRTTAPKNPARGASHGMARLTADKVRQIRAEPEYRGCLERLAERFGVTPICVANARAGRTWKHV
jgi:hypothetical protein